MKTIAFSIDGPIRGKGRPRFARNRATYTDPLTRAAENVMAWSAKQAMGSQAPFQGPIELDVVIWVCPPQKWTKAQKRAALTVGTAGLVTGRPDADNILKLAGDAMNGIVYEDDSQISDAHIRRRYRDKPGADILIKALAA